MDTKAFLTEWLIKYGTEWVKETDAPIISWGLKYIGYLDVSGGTIPTKFKLTQKALDYINDR